MGAAAGEVVGKAGAAAEEEELGRGDVLVGISMGWGRRGSLPAGARDDGGGDDGAGDGAGAVGYG